MANITVRQNGGQLAPTSMLPSSLFPASVFEPFRSLSGLMGWDPFREMAPIFRTGAETFMPAFDVKETGQSFVFRADMPGVKAQDLEVMLEGARLQVSGKRETEHEEQSDTYYSCERSFGSFTRSFTLPQSCDPKSVHAELDNGICTITIAKTPGAQAKRIPVQAGKSKT